MALPPNRLTSALATAAVLGVAGAACWLGADAAASFIETRSREDVALALRAAGHDWAEVATDGLQVTLTGTAPTEVQRFRAVAEASNVVDSTRIVDQTTVVSTETLDPPDFEVELLRNDEGISLIGLVPAGTDRLALVRRLRDETAAPQVTDLLETADYPVPEGWDAALDYGMAVAQMATRAKISIGAGRVSVTALTDSPAERARLETDLARARPEAVALSTDIAAPRPVIAPFTLRFLIDAEGPRFDACSADSDHARDLILRAAAVAGMNRVADCLIGLGAPSPDWGQAAAAAIKAVGLLQQGTVTISDTDVALTAPAEVARERFDEAVGRLEQTLPAAFSLQATHEQPRAAGEGPAEFDATVAADGTIALRGRITDERMRDAVDSFARARFKSVDSSLRSDGSVPGGWTVRVIAGIEAMATLKSGQLSVTPDLIRISGTSGDRSASTRAAAVLSERLGAGARYEMSVRYDPRLDETLGLPDGPECVALLNTTMSESAIGFEPNKSVIAGEPEATLAALKATLENCADFQIEIGGHTDSQGSEGFNADLSRARAQAILAALAAIGAKTANITARGYGESQPVASNDTDEGREANRRIEFKLLSELPVRATPLPAPEITAGVTGAAPAQTTGAAGDTAAGTVPPPPPGVGAPTADGAPADAGPDLPATAPAVVGAAETVQDGLDGAQETATVPANVPVRTPDASTPRPQKRPDEGAAAGSSGAAAPATPPDSTADSDTPGE